MAKPSAAAVLAWARLVRAHDAARGRVERALKDKGLPPLEWYDVLLELERGGPLRPRELQDRLLLAQYNLSRLLDRMAQAGLVALHPCTDDRRGQLAAATPAGRRLRRRMWPAYADAIAAVIDRRLARTEAAALAALLARLYEHEAHGAARTLGAGGGLA